MLFTCVETRSSFKTVNEPVSGNVSTNDKVPSGTTYGVATAVTGNPGPAVPTVNPDGTYTFKSDVPGVFNFLVPVCPPNQTVNCPLELLTITVLDPTKVNRPVANTDIGTTKVNTAVTLLTLTNDQSGNRDSKLDPSSVRISSPPKNGTATVDPLTGNITYTPRIGFVGKELTLTEITLEEGDWH